MCFIRFHYIIHFLDSFLGLDIMEGWKLLCYINISFKLTSCLLKALGPVINLRKDPVKLRNDPVKGCSIMYSELIGEGVRF